MSEGSYGGVKRSALSFKGEDEKRKKKRRHTKSLNIPGEPVQDAEGAGAGASAAAQDVPMVEGTGRLVVNSTTVHGFETQFKEELEVGDMLLVHHPHSLEVEGRIVTGVLSQRSCTLHSAFSKDISSTTEYHIRKDSVKLKQKAKEQIQQAGTDDPEALQDATSQELQRQLEKRLRKQRKMCSVREKSGMWGYKVVTTRLDKEASQEELLDERCKQGRDKYCF